MTNREIDSTPAQEFSKEEIVRRAKPLLEKGFAILSKVPEGKNLDREGSKPKQLAFPDKQAEIDRENITLPEISSCIFSLGEHNYYIEFGEDIKYFSLLKKNRDECCLEFVRISAEEKAWGGFYQPVIDYHSYQKGANIQGRNAQAAEDAIMKIFKQIENGSTPERSPHGN